MTATERRTRRAAGLLTDEYDTRWLRAPRKERRLAASNKAVVRKPRKRGRLTLGIKR